MEKKKGFKKYQLEMTVFICGALTMVLELVAARVLSPYVGSSHLIWTSIIGIILICMSLGYWVGGKIADKRQDSKDLSQFITIAAIATSFIPLFETMFVNVLAQNVEQLIIVAILSATFLFGIPSFTLATASPIAVKLKNSEQKEVGIVSGKISSISTIGSIMGTFLGGFVLIPNLGVSNILLGSCILLFILSFILYPYKTKKYILGMAIVGMIIIILPILGKQYFKKENPDIIKDVDSQYSRIWVKNITIDNVATYKTLQVDTGLESYINETTGEMGAKYLTYYDLFSYYNKHANKTLMIGGAAYTYPKHYLQKYEDKTIDVVEIDEKMTQIAQQEFGLEINHPNLKIYHQDGRSFLNYSQEKYDTILIDAFKGMKTPFELTTYEAMCHAKEMLNENGIVITNIISSLEGSGTKFIEHEYSTYKEVFDDVKLFAVREIGKEIEQNLILIGIKGSPEINEDKQEEYQEMLKMEITDFQTNKSIATDDFAPIGN